MRKESAIRNPQSAVRIAIVGAGPAGSTLAIRLAQAGFETMLLEKETFPRQKLCGEFISPECLKHFQELGALESMLAAGGDKIHETRFFETGGRSVNVPSSWFGDGNSFALGLSRAEMDLQLMERAKAVGVDVREGTTISNAKFEGDRMASVTARLPDGSKTEVDADIFIDATGRAAALGRQVGGKDSTSSVKPEIVGFKSHIQGANLGFGLCEIYSFPGGYAGLAHVERGKANLCLLVRSDVVRDVGSDARRIVEAYVVKNRRAAETLREFSSDEWLAVSISGFGTKRLTIAPNAFAVGDAAAFIDPFTGSGMVMAMESSAILAQAISETGRDLKRLSKEYETRYRRRFERRLRVCSLLRRTAFMPRLATVLVASLGLSTSARRLLARSTRS
ncbi:MAG TPA: NAD(P)/FAD-dependent oxidoreductase [Pyrinomonadaceae bacterium]|nr:NAD(P)/FAD-dependent oxidoreductase [Pyrinomonadaceae bacterium]